MAGVLTAYHILQDSPPDNVPSVVILEARQLCSGATGRNGGHVKVKTATLVGLKDGESRDSFQKYVWEVIEDLKSVVDQEGLDCEFELRRSFDVFLDPAEAEEIKAMYNAARMKGEEWASRISHLDERYAEQVTSIHGAKDAFSVPAASLWPYKFVTGLAEKMVDRYPATLNVQTNTPVLGISQEGVDGESTLHTSRGSIKTRKLVLATNAYTAGLLAGFEHVIVPVKGMASHHVPKTPVHPHLNHTYNIHFAPTDLGPTGVDYLNPRPDGGIVVGGGSWLFRSDVSSWRHNFDDSTRFPDHAESHWKEYMQSNFAGWEASSAQAESIWVGIMGATPDGMPHVGKVVGAEGQWVLAGFNGGGMVLIARVAKAVSAMVREGLGFEEAKAEFGLLAGFGTSAERMGGTK